MPLYFITGNENKFREAQALIPDIEQLPLDIQEVQDIDPSRILREKLRQASLHHTGPFIVEDTSLYLDAIPGLPGPLIKWFLKTIGAEGIYRLAERANIFTARASAMLGYQDGHGTLHFFEGTIHGSIVAPRGRTTFGWDPIFMPEGHEKTFAEMTLDEKNAISHRQRALSLLKQFLGTHHAHSSN
jgi:non-canonical purine NTP pyrophosphatase (RdgB/HAM1 family)